MNKKIGFIGVGNMGRAIIQGLLASQLYEAKDIMIYDAYRPIAEGLSEEKGVILAVDEVDLVEKVDMIIFAVKPTVLPVVLRGIKKEVGSDKLLISIAAGVTIKEIESCLESEAKVVRVMPNTPALVGEGMSSLSANNHVTTEQKKLILSIFSSFGQAEWVSESLVDAVVGVSGSAPAYVYMFIEALADGAVLEGMSRESAYRFAAQTVLGSAKMILDSGKHPAELKDMVASPGGTTIAAIRSLEENKFRSSVIEAVVAAAEKNKELSVDK